MYTTKQIEDVTVQAIEGVRVLKGAIDGHEWFINEVYPTGGGHTCYCHVNLDGKCIATRCRWNEALRLVARKLSGK